MNVAQSTPSRGPRALTTDELVAVQGGSMPQIATPPRYTGWSDAIWQPSSTSQSCMVSWPVNSSQASVQGVNPFATPGLLTAAAAAMASVMR